MWNWGEPVKVDAYYYTNPGGRENNEDNADYFLDEDCGFFVLADGLGGHRGGADASALVVESMLSSWEEVSGESMKEQLAACISQANEAVLKEQQERGIIMKSTVVALALNEGRAAWAHVGDSRLYHITGGRIYHATQDHSVTYKKYLMGEIRREEINFDEDRSSLLRAVGDSSKCLPTCGEPLNGGTVFPGDAFLLCSDGFWEYLFDEEILIDCLKAESPKQWAELMLLRLIPRMRPGSDNLTLITVFVREAGQEEAV